MRASTAIAGCASLGLTSCGAGVISSEDVSAGEAAVIAVVIVLALLFVGVVITRKR